MTGAPLRRCALAFTFAALAGCASGAANANDDPDAAPVIAPQPVADVTAESTAPDSTSTAKVETSAQPQAKQVDAPPAKMVTIELVADGLGLDETLVADADAGIDPFGEFATCSAYRDVAGAYAVGVSDPSADVSWLSIVSATRIDGAGPVGADVSVELASGEHVSATGTLTLASDLAAGTFLATNSAGTLLTGSFECAGSERPPITMAASDDGAIEIFALIERGGAERVVSATVLGAEPADCPAGDGTSAVVVRVDGDTSLGAISTFEIDATGSGHVMRMRVGGTSYQFADVLVALDDDARAGTFAATGPDASVAGAFGCT